MKKSIKNFIVVFILFVGVFQSSAVVFAQSNIPNATSDFYVNDFAKVFSADEKSKLMDNAVTLSNEHNGIQVVVTTVKTLDGDSIENYALQMYNQYKIGKKDMGILILLATKDRQIRVEIGRAMEMYVTDSKAGRFIDKYAYPYLKKNQFNTGLMKLQEALINEVISTTSKDKVTDSSKNGTGESSSNFLSVIIFICIIFILFVIIFSIIYSICSKFNQKKKKIDELEKQLNDLLKMNQKMHKSAIVENDNLHAKIKSLTFNNDTLAHKYDCLKESYDKLNDKYRKVQTLYPNADKEVSDMIEEEIRQKDLAIAKEIDFAIQKVISLKASKDLVSKLSEIRNSYSSLNASQKSFMKSDISKLEDLYNDSLKLKKDYDKKIEEEKNKKNAKNAEKKILSIISGINTGKEKNLKDLKKAKSIYDDLSPGAVAYFDTKLIKQVNLLYKEAKKDKKHKKDAKKRRNNTSHSSFDDFDDFDDFGGPGGFGGFGGTSGGGGASRGF